MAHQLAITKTSANTFIVTNSTTSVVTSYNIYDFSEVVIVDDVAAGANIVAMLYREGPSLRFTFAGQASEDPETAVYDDTATIAPFYTYTAVPQMNTVEGIATTSTTQLRDLIIKVLQDGYLTGQPAVLADERGHLLVTVRNDTESVLASTDGDYTALQTNSDGALRITLGAESGKLRDAAAGATDVGVQSLAVRTDTEASLVGTTGDYTPLQTNSTGALRVTFGNEIGKLEDAPHSSGDRGIMALAVRNDVGGNILADTTLDYIPLSTDAVGNQRVGIFQTYDMAVRRGLVTGHAIVRRNGVLPLLDTAGTIPSRTDPITVWPGVTTTRYSGFTSASEALNIVSTNANDTSAGTGARTVTVTGLLDASGNVAADVTATMNGTTPVALGGGPYTRCSGAFVATAGSGGRNAGTIRVYGNTSAADYAYITALVNSSTQATYTVPTGKTLYLQSIRAHVGLEASSQGNTSARWLVLALKAGVGALLRDETTFTVVVPGGPTSIETPGLSFAAGTDIVVDIVGSSSSLNDAMFLTAGFVGYLIDNTITQV